MTPLEKHTKTQLLETMDNLLKLTETGEFQRIAFFPFCLVPTDALLQEFGHWRKAVETDERILNYLCSHGMITFCCYHDDNPKKENRWFGLRIEVKKSPDGSMVVCKLTPKYYRGKRSAE